MQSRGQWGARHFDKVIFNLPIPRFNTNNELHLSIADAAEEAQRVAALVQFTEGVKFQRARALVRKTLTEEGISQHINSLVARLLDGS